MGDIYSDHHTGTRSRSLKTEKFAMIRYKGTNMAGEVFDTNDKAGAELYPMQVGAQRSILGFEDGIKQLNKGTKARLFIPSAIAYGPRGNLPVIKPNENLIFNVDPGGYHKHHAFT